ncbi:5'-deoxynucleotidase [Paenibacillus tepidiphilus]|uniref:5'-deoxynucleotidase n=1 Tax=Paenibacillus tepidiphilus TaxID=2608683 RepID=UPI001238C9E3|nr:5'-deoxynucleotidase [Paenibacillus tepidiphilus]
MTSHLFAYLFRLRKIERWSLMTTNQKENVAEHTLNVCFIVHALCLISQVIFGKKQPIDKIVQAALAHDVTEVFTGDLPTPLRYHNEDIVTQFRVLEEIASERIMRMVPEELRDAYRPMFQNQDPLIRQWIQAADLCDAWLKCKSEVAAGNQEFLPTLQQIRYALYKMSLPEVEYFIEMFGPSFDMTLEEISNTSERLTEETINNIDEKELSEDPMVARKAYKFLSQLLKYNHIKLPKNDDFSFKVIDSIQQFLNSRGIKHVLFPQGEYIEIHLTLKM